MLKQKLKITKHNVFVTRKIPDRGLLLLKSQKTINLKISKNRLGEKIVLVVIPIPIKNPGRTLQNMVITHWPIQKRTVSPVTASP